VTKVVGLATTLIASHCTQVSRPHDCGVAKALDKDGDLTQSLPEGADTWFAVVFAPEEAAPLGDQHLAQIAERTAACQQQECGLCGDQGLSEGSRSARGARQRTETA